MRYTVVEHRQGATLTVTEQLVTSLSVGANLPHSPSSSVILIVTG